MSDTPHRPLHTTADGLEVSALTRRRELLPWFAYRFFHIRLVYNWAWDPDRFDWSPIAHQYRIREHRRRTVGGYRIIAPRASLDEAMTPALPFFRTMAHDPSVWGLLDENRDLVVEVSRFILSFHRLGDRSLITSIVRLATRGIFWEQARLARPLCLVVVNPFLLARYRRFGLALKVIGARRLPARTAFEQKTFGKNVPHYVVLLNSALSARLALEGRLTDGLTPEYIFDGMREHAQPFHAMGEAFHQRVQAVWDAVREMPATS